MNENLEPRIVYKKVEPVLVACLRFLGQHAEIPERFEQLRSRLGGQINGDPICLYDRTADDVPEAHYLEVCFPIPEPVEMEGITCRILEGSPVLSAIHPYPADCSWGPAEWWGKVGAYLRENYITVDEDPLREIRFVEGGIEMSEVQLVLQFPRWMEALSQGLSPVVPGEVRTGLFIEESRPSPLAPVQERLAWVQGAVQALEQALPDPQARGPMLHPCAHRFPQVRIEKIRHLYQELGSVDALIEWIRADKAANGGISWYGNPSREGNILYDVKDPASPQEYEAATTEREKRMARCFCPLVRAAIKNDLPLSNTFCNCSAGYTLQFWQSVLQQPLGIQVVESVLKGDPACKFAMSLPPVGVSTP